MNYEELYQKIIELPVFDGHTHMESGWRQSTKGLYARNFFDIAWYFWFKRELEAAGYPMDYPKEFTEDDYPAEAKVLHEALQKNRNTYWTGTIMQAMDNLYGVRPDSVDRILELSALMKKTSKRPEWGNEVCDKLNIKKIVANFDDKGVTEPIKERMLTAPAFGINEDMISGILEAERFDKALDEAKEELSSKVKELYDRGIRTIRTAWPFVHDIDLAAKKDFSAAELKDAGNLRQYLGHHLFSQYEKYNYNLQIFVGMRGPKPQALSGKKFIRTYAANDTSNISAKHNIFEMYLGCTFEFFCATELNSLDIVQAARIYPNVYPGGLWWFNFRRSVYEKNMQYRVEALPACRSTFVASDARCIEWCYIKILLIKRIMAGFFHRQIEEGWLDEEAALYTARYWLHDTAAKLYLR